MLKITSHPILAAILCNAPPLVFQPPPPLLIIIAQSLSTKSMGWGGEKVLIKREHLIEEISELKARGRRALMSLIGY